MSYKDDCKGTSETEFRVGMAGGGQRIFSVFNGFLARMLWTPTATRDITVPDASGTILLLDTNGRATGITPANANGQAATYEQIGSSFLFGSTLTDGTTLTVATHGNKRLPVNGGTINLPADASWATDVVFEFVSVGSNPTVITWAGNTLVSQDTGSLASQVIGGAITATALVVKMASGVTYLYSGTARGIDATAVTLGTNPNTPAVGATANYNFVNAAGLADEGIYRFSGIEGIFKVTDIVGNTVTIENVSAPVGTAVPSGTKLAPTGAKGDAGTNGTNGIDAIAITTGTNPNTPAVGATANYNFVNATGLALDGLYRFSGIVGPFKITAIAGNTVTLENVSATVGATVSAGTKLTPTGIKGDAGVAGINAIATTTGTNPNTPGLGLSANYTVDSAAGLVTQQYYGFNNLAGAFLLTAIAGSTVTLQNASAASGITIAAGTKLVPVARPLLDYTPVPIRSGSDVVIADSSGIGTQAQVANTLRAWHWEVKKAMTLVALRQEVSTLLAGATFRLALYADNGSLYPGAIVANSDVATAYDAATAGVKLGTFTASIVLNPGSYFLAVNNSGTPTFRAIPVNSLSSVLGGIATGGTNGTATCWSIAQAFGAMPATFPAGATLTGNVSAPYTMFRTA